MPGEAVHRRELDDAQAAQSAVERAEEVRATTERTAAEVARNRPGRLIDLSKAELLDLATAEGIEGRTSMTKKELATALGRAGSRLQRTGS